MEFNKVDELTKPSGGYWDSLKELGLPFYIYLNDELVIVMWKEWKKVRGKGRHKQCYFHLSDGRVKHASKFKQCNVVELNRQIKLQNILDL